MFREHTRAGRQAQPHGKDFSVLMPGRASAYETKQKNEMQPKDRMSLSLGFHFQKNIISMAIRGNYFQADGHEDLKVY